MKPKKIGWVFYFSLILSHHIISQNIEIVPSSPSSSFTHYSTEEGLSQSSVSAMLTDDEGYIWVGTQDGLNRFDGYEFQVFRSNENSSSGLSSNFITDLLLDEKGDLWIGTLDGGLNHLNKKSGVFTNYKLGQEKAKKIGSNNIRELEIDQEGNLWIGTLAGLLKFSTSEKKYKDIDDQLTGDLRNNKIIGLFVDFKNQLWASTPNALFLYQIDREGLEKIDNFELDFFTRIGLESNLSSDVGWNKPPAFIAEDHDSNLLFLNGKILIKYSPSNNQFNLINIELEKDNTFTSLYIDLKGGYWITSLKRLFHLQTTNNGYQQSSFIVDKNNPNSISSGSKIYAVTQDSSGNMWAGSWAGGLNGLSVSPKKFKDIRENPLINNTVNDLTVVGLHVDNNSNVWLGTWGDGLYKLSPKQSKSKVFRHISSDPNSITSSTIPHINQDDKNNLWVSTFDGGLNKLNLKTEKFQPYWSNSNEVNDLNSKNLLFSFDDSDHNLWVSTFQSGLYHLDFENEILKTYSKKPSDSSSISDDRPRTVFEDSQKRLWVTTNGGGLNLFNKRDSSFRHFRHKPDNPHSIPNNVVNTIFESSIGDIWIGTYSGFAKLVNLETGKFQRYSTENGLANNVICAIEEDNQYRLWMSTFSGISCFDVKSGEILNYNNLDGISNQEFNTRTSSKDPNTGEIYFGGQTTGTYFQPNDFFRDTINSKIVISKMTVHNSGKGASEKRQNLFLNSSKNYRFSHLDKILRFEIASLSFINAAQQKYQYQLSGFSEQWYELEESRDIVFTNLDPGSYTLFAKALNADGYWSNSQQMISFSISPPWYKTLWAYTLFIALFSMGLYAVYRFQLSQKTALQEANRLTELNDLKTRFYTNITHEFRTPLTIIMGMVDNLKSTPHSIENEKSIGLIGKNSDRLLKLVNEILSLVKLENSAVSMNFIQGNVVSLIAYIVESLKYLAKTKSIDLIFYAEQDEINMDYDPDRLTTVMINLISNAIKFTPKKGQIFVHTSSYYKDDKQYLNVNVKDNGKGISKADLPFIFQKYFQSSDQEGMSNKGTGIGLALAKELIKAMDGNIVAESIENEGSTFKVELPITNKSAFEEFLPIPLNHFENDEKANTRFPDEMDPSLPLVLVVEDHEDVASYIISCLENYNVVLASNGLQGKEIAELRIPEIIISDIIMPEMDGYELCKSLKTNLKTDHIPIILLTAKATEKDKVLGFMHGADAYLTKPFSKLELIARIDQLIASRKNILAKVQNQGIESFIRENREDPSLKFLNLAIVAVHSNIDNSHFGPPLFAKEMGMSESQLYKKLKATTGKSTALFIRSIRLEKARLLILTTKKSISEISYDTGFNDPSWFSRAFKLEFGYSPSEVENSDKTDVKY